MKNEKSLFGRIEKFFWSCYSKEPLRFLFWGAINSFITIINTYWIRAVFVACDWNIKAFEDTNGTIDGTITPASNVKPTRK